MNFRHHRSVSILLLGLLGVIPSASRASPYEPLDCSKASTTAEITVCKNYALGQDEARQATLFAALTSLVAMGQRADLIDAQRRWIAAREACRQDEKCLSLAYKTHIDDLSHSLESLAKRGPF